MMLTQKMASAGTLTTVDLNEIATVVKHLSRKRNASGQLDSHVSAYNSVWTLYG